MRNRLKREIEQRLRLQGAKAERTVDQNGVGQQSGMNEQGQQQSVCPQREAGENARDCTSGRSTPPHQTAEESWRELRDGGEGQQADRGERH